jgi:hypothetical protein
MTRCSLCYGNGKVMGGGMMSIDCPACKLDDVLSNDKIVVDKRSKTYKDAIAKIMEASNVSKDEASRIFDEEFEKL